MSSIWAQSSESAGPNGRGTRRLSASQDHAQLLIAQGGRVVLVVVGDCFARERARARWGLLEGDGDRRGYLGEHRHEVAVVGGEVAVGGLLGLGLDHRWSEGG